MRTLAITSVSVVALASIPLLRRDGVEVADKLGVEIAGFDPVPIRPGITIPLEIEPPEQDRDPLPRARPAGAARRASPDRRLGRAADAIDCELGGDEDAARLQDPRADRWLDGERRGIARVTPHHLPRREGRT